MIGYLDCSSGISGDMFVGALIDAGLDFEALAEKLRGIGIAGFSITRTPVTREGVTGTQFVVTENGIQPDRRYVDIVGILRESGLAHHVREDAMRAVQLLAEAEADVHGVPIEEVHFHEIGAIDTIVDLVAASIGLHELGITELYSSPVTLGHGTVETSHGTLPVPAPATARLLTDVPTVAGEIEAELTTPTGATLLRTFVSGYGPPPPLHVSATGAGAGSRELPGVPNMLRVMLGVAPGQAMPAPAPATPTPAPATPTPAGAPSQAPAGTPDLAVDRVVVLETSIDHVTPEDLATALDAVMAAGAIDCWQAPIFMKKGRLGVAVTVLTAPEDAARIAALLMTATGTLGVRRRETERYVAERQVRAVQTSFGPVRVKTSEVAGTPMPPRPEHDDVAEVAARTGSAIKDVAARLAAEAARLAKAAEKEDEEEENEKEEPTTAEPDAAPDTDTEPPPVS